MYSAFAAPVEICPKVCPRIFTSPLPLRDVTERIDGVGLVGGLCGPYPWINADIRPYHLLAQAKRVRLMAGNRFAQTFATNERAFAMHDYMPT
jgi:hypothetical protein